jgi:starch synthase
MGLDGLMSRRKETLFGIVNGIDTEVWNPGTDTHLAATYSAKAMKGRKTNRRELDKVFGLEPGGALLIVVSRLTWQKGMDLLVEAADDLVAIGARLAVLGTGDAALEGAFHSASARHRGRIGFTLGYDEPLAHLMQGGADAILVPSRFEPCGLTQLYGLRYGCVPVVARTGGLADTVIDANAAALAAKVATGIMFEPMSADALRDAVRRAALLHGDDAAWTAMQRQGMRSDVSWENSAARYADLYASLTQKENA